MNKYSTVLIIVISILVPGLVAALFFGPVQTRSNTLSWISWLPHVNAIINSLTAVILILGFILIRNGKKGLHKQAMLTALSLGIIFFISYISYHASVPSQIFGDINGNGALDPEELQQVGTSRRLYLSLLLTHIGLAVLAVPLVLLAFYFALNGNFDKHKKIVRFTLPVWLVVSISGVAVYIMISPYY